MSRAQMDRVTRLGRYPDEAGTPSVSSDSEQPLADAAHQVANDLEQQVPLLQSVVDGGAV